MDPVMLCFLRFPRVFDLICHSEYLPSSKVPLNKRTHRSFWAICLTFTSSFHLRSPRTTCRREPGNSVFIWTTHPSNQQIFHTKIWSLSRSWSKFGCPKRSVTIFRRKNGESGPTCHPSPRSRQGTCSLVEAPMGLKQRCQNFVPFDQDLRDVQVEKAQILRKTKTHGEY